MRAHSSPKNPVPATIKVWPPSRRAMVPKPETAYGLLGTNVYVVRHWTAEEWSRIPDLDRPEETLVSNRGGHFIVEPTADKP